MINNYMAIIYLNNNQSNLDPLTKYRPIASLPIGGSYRLIDFPLSNIVNAGIRNVGIFCNNTDETSLNDHIGIGSEWDLNRRRDGIFVFKNILEGDGKFNFSRLQRNIEYFSRSTQENVLVTNSHMIYNIDFSKVIEEHEKSKKDVTLVYKKVNNADSSFNNCEIMTIKDNELKCFKQNLFLRNEENIFMETFIVSKKLFLELLLKIVHEGEYRGVNDIIKKNIDIISINLFEFKESLYCINDIKRYFEFNMDILNKDVREELFGIKNNRKIFTKMKDTPPTLFKSNVEIKNSLISNGCIIKGKVYNSILGRGSIVEEGVEIYDSIILQDCKIKKNSTLKNVILDKNNVISENQKLISSRENPLILEKKLKFDMNDYTDKINTISERKG